MFQNIISSHHLSPLTSEVVGAPQLTLQQYLSTLPCLPLPSGNLQTPFPSILWCYLSISSSVFLSFLLLSLSPAELSSPCPRILRCGLTIWVSFSLPWLGDHPALQLHSWFCCEHPRSSNVPEYNSMWYVWGLLYFGLRSMPWEKCISYSDSGHPCTTLDAW